MGPLSHFLSLLRSPPLWGSPSNSFCAKRGEERTGLRTVRPSLLGLALGLLSHLYYRGLSADVLLLQESGERHLDDVVEPAESLLVEALEAVLEFLLRDLLQVLADLIVLDERELVRLGALRLLVARVNPLLRLLENPGQLRRIGAKISKRESEAEGDG